MSPYLALRGGIAQLGEHLPCKQGVMSSNLIISTKAFSPKEKIAAMKAFSPKEKIAAMKAFSPKEKIAAETAFCLMTKS